MDKETSELIKHINDLGVVTYANHTLLVASTQMIVALRTKVGQDIPYLPLSPFTVYKDDFIKIHNSGYDHELIKQYALYPMFYLYQILESATGHDNRFMESDLICPNVKGKPNGLKWECYQTIYKPFFAVWYAAKNGISYVVTSDKIGNKPVYKSGWQWRG